VVILGWAIRSSLAQKRVASATLRWGKAWSEKPTYGTSRVLDVCFRLIADIDCADIEVGFRCEAVARAIRMTWRALALMPLIPI